MSDKATVDQRDSLEQVSVGIVRATHESLILRCNVRFADILGYSQDEVPGLTFKEITAPEDVAAFMEALQRLWSGATDAMSLETRFIRKDGSLTWIKLTASVQSDVEGQALYLLTLVEDIKLRKAAEENLLATAEALQAREERYLNAFQTCPDAVLIIRLSNGTIIDANRAYLDIMGFESQEVIGRTSMELGMWADATDRQRLANALHENSGCRDLEVRLRRKNGEDVLGTVVGILCRNRGRPLHSRIHTRCVCGQSGGGGDQESRLLRSAHGPAQPPPAMGTAAAGAHRQHQDALQPCAALCRSGRLQGVERHVWPSCWRPDAAGSRRGGLQAAFAKWTQWRDWAAMSSS